MSSLEAMPLFDRLPTEIVVMILKHVVPEEVVLTVTPNFDAILNGKPFEGFVRIFRTNCRGVFLEPSQPTQQGRVTDVKDHGTYHSFGLDMSWNPTWITNLLLINKYFRCLAQPLVADRTTVRIQDDGYNYENGNPRSFEFTIFSPAINLGLLPTWLLEHVRTVHLPLVPSQRCVRIAPPNTSALVNLETIISGYRSPSCHFSCAMAYAIADPDLLVELIKEVQTNDLRLPAAQWNRADISKCSVWRQVFLNMLRQKFEDEIDWEGFNSEEFLEQARVVAIQ